jgi:hypothetical protein
MPIHKGVESTSSFDNLHSGADTKVVGVAQNYLGFYFQEFPVIQSLDTGLSPDWHENRCFDGSMCRKQTAPAGFACCICFNQRKHSQCKMIAALELHSNKM